MKVYACAICGYEYVQDNGDVEGGIAEGVEFEDIPSEWVCPICGAAKDEFELVYPDDE